MSAYTVVPAEGLVKLDAMENPYRLPETLRRGRFWFKQRANYPLWCMPWPNIRATAARI